MACEYAEAGRYFFYGITQRYVHEVNYTTMMANAFLGFLEMGGILVLWGFEYEYVI